MFIRKKAAGFMAAVLTAGLLLGGCGSEEVPEETTLPPTIATFVEETTEAPETTVEETQPVSPIVQNKEEEQASSEAAESEAQESLEEAIAAAPITEEVIAKVASMTLKEKVLQMFIIRPEVITGVPAVTVAGNVTKEAIGNYPVGGFVFDTKNVTGVEQATSLLSGIQGYEMDRIGLPAFLCVSEAGGSYSTIASITELGIEGTPSAADIAAQGTNEAKKTGKKIGTYLDILGFNVDLAPVADMLSNPENANVAGLSYSSKAKEAGKMAVAFAEGLTSQGIIPTYMYFPGYGQAAGDPGQNPTNCDKTLEELLDSDVKPFKRAVNNGAPIIMVSHLAFPNIVGNDLPSCMAPQIAYSILREELDFDGIVMTDSLSKGAVTQRFGAGDAALKCVLAGCDVIYDPADFQEALNAILNAVQAGQIDEERITASVERIVALKAALN